MWAALDLILFHPNFVVVVVKWVIMKLKLFFFQNQPRCYIFKIRMFAHKAAIHKHKPDFKLNQMNISARKNVHYWNAVAGDQISSGILK